VRALLAALSLLAGCQSSGPMSAHAPTVPTVEVPNPFFCPKADRA
jgi:uncharacterized lipoprotein YajG